VGAAKQKAVINAERSQLDRVRRLIDSGRYRTLSEFAREALDEKLERIEQGRVAEAVERYCAAGHAVKSHLDESHLDELAGTLRAEHMERIDRALATAVALRSR
jgi:Arc/MetJ-type ribon-helix-helix transcriptional regulator